jgi:hypothetical protein
VADPPDKKRSNKLSHCNILEMAAGAKEREGEEKEKNKKEKRKRNKEIMNSNRGLLQHSYHTQFSHS